MANSTDTSASVGWLMTGISNRYASSCHAVDTSLRRPGAPGRDDVDVVEFVGAAGGSAHADLNHVTHVLCPYRA